MLVLLALLAHAAFPSGDYFIEEPASRICIRLSIASATSQTRSGVVERTRQPAQTCGPAAPGVADDAGAWMSLGRFRCERELEDGWLALDFVDGDTLDGCTRRSAHTATVTVALVSDSAQFAPELVTLRPSGDCHALLALTAASTHVSGVFYAHDTDTRICTRLTMQTDDDERWDSLDAAELARTLAPPRGGCDASAFAERSEYVLGTNLYAAEARLDAHALELDALPFLAESSPSEGCAAGVTFAFTSTERPSAPGDDGAPTLHWKAAPTAPDCRAEIELSVSAHAAADGGGASRSFASEQACDALEASSVLGPLWLMYAEQRDDELGDAFWSNADQGIMAEDARSPGRAGRGESYVVGLWARLHEHGQLLASTTRALPSPCAAAQLAAARLRSSLAAGSLSWLVVAIPLAAALVATHARARQAKAKEASAAAKALMV